VLLRERPLKGLLGGMLETPSTPWEETAPNGKAVADHAPVEAAWDELPGLVEHTFTHFHLQLAVYRAEVGADAALTGAAEPERCLWLHVRDLHGAALPSLMRKVIAHALEQSSRQARR
jgi:A/G-specific adenine glycosylase